MCDKVEKENKNDQMKNKEFNCKSSKYKNRYREKKYKVYDFLIGIF